MRDAPSLQVGDGAAVRRIPAFYTMNRKYTSTTAPMMMR